MTIHVMLDLETLGLTPGCPIVAIGASTFLWDTDRQKFYVAVDPNLQDRMEAPDEATLKWWSTQSEEARAEVFNNPYVLSLEEALNRFADWILRLKKTGEKVFIWGNGATFDEPIIAEALKRYGIPVPWTFREAMCFRTLKTLGALAGVQEPEFVGTKHNALADAVHQASYARLILQEFKRGQDIQNC